MDAFFTQTSYDERAWTFGDLTVRAGCSNAASTDYDLTGQVPWPALTVLGHWLASAHGARLVTARSCLELGAGIGVTGLLAAAQRCSSLTLTDHNSYIVELLDQNIELNEELYLHMAETPAAVELDWETPPPPPEALHLYAEEEQEEAEQDPARLGFGVILASDCLYCEAAVKPLFDTAMHWLAADGVWVMAHIARWDNVEDALAAELARRPELVVEEVDLSTFLPHAMPGYVPPEGDKGVIGMLRVPVAAAGEPAEAAAAAAVNGTDAKDDGEDAEAEAVETGVDGHSLKDCHVRLIRWVGGVKPPAAVLAAAREARPEAAPELAPEPEPEAAA